MSWIKRKIISWLGIDVHESAIRSLDERTKRTESTAQVVDALSSYANYIRDRMETQRMELIQIQLRLIRQDDRLRNMEDLIHVGIDVHEHKQTGRSWAVVCLNGKPDFVKFYDLSNKDAKHIREWMKQFDTNNKTIDASPHMFGFFKEGDKE